EIKWETESKKYATVDENGLVTPHKEGTTTITARTHNGKKATVKVKVVDPYKPTGVKIDQTGTVTLRL
ncbi:MAG: Ig-like domain-containing protein, partial [Clostridia bacterium]|nr:Ig-like domain-containing protein [Clostridia bacterium]